MQWPSSLVDRLQSEIKVTFAFITTDSSRVEDAKCATQQQAQTRPDESTRMLPQVSSPDALGPFAGRNDIVPGRWVMVKLYDVHRQTAKTQPFLCHSSSRVADLESAVRKWLGKSQNYIIFCPSRSVRDAKALPLASHVLHGSDKIPDVVFCQCTTPYGPFDANVKGQWLVVNVLLLRASGNPVIGHLPLVLPFTAPLTHEMCVQHIVSLCRCSSEQASYMLAHTLLMLCNTHRGQITLCSTIDRITSAMQVALLLPPIETGDVICVGKHDEARGTDLLEQGVIVRQRAKNGVTLFDIRCMQTQSIREGVTCLHITPL